MKSLRDLFLVVSVFIISLNICIGQGKFISVSASNNTTGLPVIAYPDLFYSQFHPGIELAYGHQLNDSDQNKLRITGNVGYYYHQFVQSLIRFYPTINYERQFSPKFVANIGLGAGYGLSFEGKNAFILKEDGSYHNKRFFGARSQYLIAFELGVGYKLLERENSPLLVLGFKSFMQGTYVKSYVPLLPLNSFNVGLQFPL